MTSEIIIAILLICVGLYIFATRKKNIQKITEMSSEINGPLIDNAKSLSAATHERNALFAGIVFCASGLILLFVNRTDLPFPSQISISAISALFFLIISVSFIHTLIWKRNWWSVGIGLFMTIATGLFFLSTLG